MRFLFVYVLAIFSHSAIAQADGRESRMLNHARYCIVIDLIVSKLPSASANIQEPTCRAAELGLFFVGERTSSIALKELIGLRRYVLDAALGETYTCYILAKGNKAAKAFSQFDVSSEQKRCEVELANSLNELGLPPNSVQANSVCASPQRMKQWISEMSDAIRAHRTCGLDDW